MVPRPFPLPLRVGIDMCHLPRIRRILGARTPEQERLHRFIRHLLTPREEEYFKVLHGGSNIDEADNSERAVTFLAGRWAAKEACIKAVKPRKVTPMEIEVWPDRNRETFAIILDEVAVQSKTELDKPEQETSQSPPSEERAAKRAAMAEDMPSEPDTFVPSHEDVRGQIARLSISHDGEYAFAVAMAWAEPAPGDVGSEDAARQPTG